MYLILSLKANLEDFKVDDRKTRIELAKEKRPFKTPKPTNAVT